MLTPISGAATRLSLTLITAVLFSSNCSAQDNALRGLESGLTDLIFHLSRSVVTVETARLLPTSRFGSASDETYTWDLTTGIVIDSGGLILVAARPVLGKGRITVRFASHAVNAELVAVDYQTELAVLRAADTGGVPPLLAGNHACAGQMVIAVGQAFGLRSSPSLGFCAGLRGDGVMQFSLPNLGSRLGNGIFDLSGHLLGIVTDVIGRDRAMTVAVPAHRIPGIVRYLVTKGDRQSGFAGITTQEIEISPGLALPYPEARLAASREQANVIERGVVVTSVVPRSPAERAGLAVGDLIFAVDRISVNSAPGLASLVRQSRPESILNFDVLRHNKYLTLPVTIGRKSIDISREAPRAGSATDQDRSVDSLRLALEQMRIQLKHLENRLDGLD